jgi:predicted outer membrane repeat protein
VKIQRWSILLPLALLVSAAAANGEDAKIDRLAVQARESCEPALPDCSIAAALAVLADGGTLELSAGRFPARLVLARDVTIEGAGAGRTILDGGGAGRVLKIEPGVRVTVRGVTVTGGRLDKELERDGGGIWNEGTLRLERCEVAGNTAVDDGGGIRNDGKLTLHETAVRDNRATRWGSVGGGIYSPVIATDPELEIVASTISGNVAGDNGGGIWCEGTASLVDSTVRGNSAAHTGGGIRNNGRLTLVNSTVAFNRAGTTGGGIRNFGVATLTKTILAANSAAESGADCQGPLTSQGNNTVMRTEGCEIQAGPGDQMNVDPKLEGSLPPATVDGKG